MPPSSALLGGFAIGARVGTGVALLWQHNANAKCFRVYACTRSMLSWEIVMMMLYISYDSYTFTAWVNIIVSRIGDYNVCCFWISAGNLLEIRLIGFQELCIQRLSTSRVRKILFDRKWNAAFSAHECSCCCCRLRPISVMERGVRFR